MVSLSRLDSCQCTTMNPPTVSGLTFVKSASFHQELDAEDEMLKTAVPNQPVQACLSSLVTQQNLYIQTH